MHRIAFLFLVTFSLLASRCVAFQSSEKNPDNQNIKIDKILEILDGRKHAYYFTPNIGQTEKDFQQLQKDLETKFLKNIFDREVKPQNPSSLSKNGILVSPPSAYHNGFVAFKIKDGKIAQQDGKPLNVSKLEEQEIFQIILAAKGRSFFYSLPTSLHGFHYQGFFFGAVSKNDAVKLASQIGKKPTKQSGTSTRKSKLKFDSKDLERFGIGFTAGEVSSELSDSMFFLMGLQSQLNRLERNFSSALSKIKPGYLIYGFKYAHRILEFRSIFLSDFNALKDHIDFEGSSRPWNPDLGFPKQRFLGSAAINLSAFRSGAAPRMIIKSALPFAAETTRSKFMESSTLRNLLEIVADSWLDCRAARIGVFHSRPRANALPTATIIGVIDNKRSGGFILKQLKRISLLTAGNLTEEEKSERNEEIRSWVDCIHCPGVHTEARAETRLLLAGKPALKHLQEILDTPDLPSSKNKLKQARKIHSLIQNQIRIQNNKTPTRVSSPEFWLELNPKLRFHPGPVKDGEGLHTVKISPDPDKTPEEVEAASQLMAKVFGPDWANIQVQQIRGHFIFVLGSDKKLFQTVISNVKKKHSELSPGQKDKIVIGQNTGPIQVALNLAEINSLVTINPVKGMINPQVADRGMARLGILPKKDRLELWIRTTVDQLNGATNWD